MIYRNISTVTFDIGGTLLFPHPSVGEVYARVLEAHGRPCDPAALDEAFFRVWKQFHPVPLREISEAGERARWRDVIDATFADFANGVNMDVLFEDLWETFARPENWRWTEDTEPTLRELRHRGYRLAVFSNWDSRLRPLLQQTGLAAHFDELFISCEIGCEKPQPAAFRLVRKALGCEPSDILHIGDSHHHDIRGAEEEGWNALHLTNDAQAGRGQIAALRDILSLLPRIEGR